MTLTTETNKRVRQPFRQMGYALAAGINFALLVIVNIVWDDVAFITEEFSKVLWVVSLSLLASVLANVAYILFDPPWFKGVGELTTGLVGLFATWRVWTIFPFDFSAYSFPWETLTRVILIIALVGSAIGVLASLVKVARSA